MWWLNDNWDDEAERNRSPVFHRRSAATRIPSLPRSKRVSLLTEAEAEANKRLMEIGSIGSDLASRSNVPNRDIQRYQMELKRQALQQARTIQQLKEGFAAETDACQQELQSVRDASTKQNEQLTDELHLVRRALGDHVREREHSRLQQDRLRKLLQEAEQSLDLKTQQLGDLREEMDEQVAASDAQIQEREQRHQLECAYLRSMASDAEQRAEKAEQEIGKLRDFVLRLTAAHRAQLNENLRNCELNVQDARDQWEVATKKYEQQCETFQQQAQQLEDSESKRRVQTQQLASIVQQQQISESVVRQMKSETDAQLNEASEKVEELRQQLQESESTREMLKNRCDHVTAAWQVSQVELSRMKQRFNELLDHSAHSKRADKLAIATLTRQTDQLREELSRQKQQQPNHRRAA